MTTMEKTAAASAADSASLARELFLVGFLVLFLELACIRWFAAYVVFLQFFTNVILLAAFLGMSSGCLAARSKRDWLRLSALCLRQRAFPQYVQHFRNSNLQRRKLWIEQVEMVQHRIRNLYIQRRRQAELQFEVIQAVIINIL